MGESIVKVENLSHRYSVQWAVKDINFELTKNGIYGLLGANGAGKSTIMNIMCGVVRQTQGEVFIRGINLRENPIEAKKYIGFLPQLAPLHTDLTVEEYLRHSARIRLMNPATISKAIDEVMEKVAITHFRKRLIKNLSGGYQQRVGIAQAIIHKPDFLVLDEPTNGLDPNQILEVRNLIKQIATERTVILSTHILQEVQALCNEIWMINDGQVVFSGAIDEFDNYLMPSTLTVSFMHPPSADELKGLPGIIGAENINRTKFKVQFSNAQDAIDSLVKASVDKQWTLQEVGLDKNSLEEVFSELSRKKSH